MIDFERHRTGGSAILSTQRMPRVQDPILSTQRILRGRDPILSIQRIIKRDDVTVV